MRIATLAAGVAVLLPGCVVTPPYQANPAGPPPMAYPGYAYQANMEQYGEPPPPLPVYEQPPCPMDGYLWSPGFWRASPAGYFWVPGTWVLPPGPGLLWTPGYWALGSAVYVYHAGYWAPHVGYYGGINYGHGYFGDGYAGGRWSNNRFQYNTAITNVNRTTIHNTYHETIVNNTNVTNITNVTRVSYVGGPGTRAQPSAREAFAARDAHIPPTAAQIQHETAARSEPQFNAARNNGHPPIAATPRAAEFAAPGATPAASGGPEYRPAGQAAEHRPSGPVAHARDLPRALSNDRPTGLATAEQQPHARSQPDVQARYEQERQNLALQQEQEHASLTNRPTHDQQAYEAMEKRHQQQTEQLQQRHQREIEHDSNNEAGHSEPEGAH